jgi:hypothetical protein
MDVLMTMLTYIPRQRPRVHPIGLLVVVVLVGKVLVGEWNRRP